MSHGKKKSSKPKVNPVVNNQIAQPNQPVLTAPVVTQVS